MAVFVQLQRVDVAPRRRFPTRWQPAPRRVSSSCQSSRIVDNQPRVNPQRRHTEPGDTAQLGVTIPAQPSFLHVGGVIVSNRGAGRSSQFPPARRSVSLPRVVPRLVAPVTGSVAEKRAAPDSLAHPADTTKAQNAKAGPATARDCLWRIQPLLRRTRPAVPLSLAGCAAMRIIGVDHTGPEPVLV